MKRVAIVAYHHPESTLPLVKHLTALGCGVDYTYVTASGRSGAPAFEFGRTLYLPGIRRGNARFMGDLYRYFGTSRVDVALAVVPPYARRVFGPYTRSLFFRLGRAVRQGAYDLVLVVGQDAFLADLHRGLGHSPTVHHALHEVTPHWAAQEVSFSLVDRLVEDGTNLVVHSAAARRMLAARYGARLVTVSTIPFGVFETYLHGVSGAADPPMVAGPYFLFVGTLLPYKGLDVLQAAVESLGERLNGFKVVVAGAGSDPAVARMQAHPRFVVLHRYLDNREVVNLTQHAACVVCPYRSASQSGIISTAFLFGKPVIASDVGAFGEFVETGHNGVLTPAGDAAQLAAAMARVANDRPFRARLEAGAKSFASDPRFSWDSIARRYLALMPERADAAGRTRP